MTLFGLFGALCVAVVVGQLDGLQHAALMEVYNATGAVFFLSFFLFVADGAGDRLQPKSLSSVRRK